MMIKGAGRMLFGKLASAKGVSHPPMPNKNCLDFYDMVPIDDYDDDDLYHLNRQFTAKNFEEKS